MGQAQVVENPQAFEDTTKMAVLNGLGVKQYLSARETQSLKLLAMRNESRACTFSVETGEPHSVSVDNNIWTGMKTSQRLFSRLKRAALALVNDKITEIEKQAYVSGDESAELEIWKTKRYNLEQTWTITVVDSPEPNAFVHGLLPRHVFITQGLLTHMKNLDNQTALVLGHELSHYLLDHNRDSLLGQFLIRSVAIILTSLIDPTGGLGGFLIELSMPLLTGVIEAASSRDHEREADKFGLEVCARACFDPRQSIPMFETLKNIQEEMTGKSEENLNLTMLSSHPLSQERYENAVEQLPQAMEIYRECSWLYRKYVELVYGHSTRDHLDLPHPKHPLIDQTIITMPKRGNHK